MNIERIKKSLPLSLGLVALLISVIVFFNIVRNHWTFTVDDSYITFRYARNWAEGFGPVFNRGESPTEGYTTFLWMSVMTLPYLLKVDALEFVKWIGVVFTLATMLLIFLFVLQLTSQFNILWRYISAGAAVLVMSLFGANALHAVAGMETPLFTFLLITFFYILTLYVWQPTPLKIGWLTLVSLLLGLTRPEGNLVALVGLAAALVLIAQDERKQFAKRVALFYFLPGALYFAWRMMYYGALLPLPFYVKVLARVIRRFAGCVGLFEICRRANWITDPHRCSGIAARAYSVIARRPFTPYLFSLSQTHHGL